MKRLLRPFNNRKGIDDSTNSTSKVIVGLIVSIVLAGMGITFISYLMDTVKDVIEKDKEFRELENDSISDKGLYYQEAIEVYEYNGVEFVINLTCI